MANNSQPPGAQPLWPPPAGSQNFGTLQMQYRPMVPNQQGQSFISASSQQFRPVGPGMPSSHVGMPGAQDLPLHFPQSMQPFPPRSNQPGHAPPPMPYGHTNRPIPSSTPYPFAPSSFGQPQHHASVPSQIPPMPQMHAPIAGQLWGPGGGQGASPAMPQQAAQQPPAASPAAASVPTQQSSSDWQEHEAANGRRYYYNKKTKQSSWEKPLELMTPIERADASTVWKEFSTSDGRKYYYNKVTKQSVWSMPEEMKLAREQALKADGGVLEEAVSGSQGSAAGVAASVETPSAATSSSPSVPFSVAASSPIPVTPAVPVTNATTTAVSGPVGTPVATSSVLSNDVGGQDTVVPNQPIAASSQNVQDPEDGASIQLIEEAKRGMATAGKVNVTPLEEKTPDDEPVTYPSKQEAKNAFKALLESFNVQSDWTWEHAMREIINDKRYGALKTLGERKQAFNEYLGQRRKLEAEERRVRQKKAREEFTKMLEECKELTSSIKWSKAVSMFENDERFKAVEKNRDREDLFDSFMVDLERKEKEKAAEEHRHNITEYRKYLESCDFIKVNSQWRKIIDRLEDDERYLRLEKIDRLLIYQDYIRDMEKEEEEGKKIQKEQTRRAERKNRDEFRKLMEGHASAGILTAKTHWRDYCLKVKDSAEYQAVASNTSGSTPRELFEDVAEELEVKFYEDKVRVKDAMKSGKVSMVSTWTFEDFRAGVLDNLGHPLISEINLEELLERAKEKEEKEAKKRQRIADDFTRLLHTFKEITLSSTWEECKPLVEESYEFKSVGEESSAKEIFEEYIAHLQEKAKEKERKREEEKVRKEKEREEKEKRKDKERKERDREREREKGKERSKKDDTDSDTADANDSYGYKDDKKREKEKERKHRKRHQSASDEVYSDKEEKESKRSRRQSSDRKKSRKHAHSPVSDGESRHKKHKRDHRDSSRRNGGYEELEDGEVGEDGEIQQS
ncbi:pre-mRNA-processing protein 40A isoform X2 [Punica granatum]|uniref:Pre-mRNA-processing protein 40A isoform X2 n=1 Tax=Punica granatum TaxID=22663 RepID=A0A6P8C2T2_PUNGR|nr:pre-mRNA-processing protein 40A isoform X2 [Punica granatum]